MPVSRKPARRLAVIVAAGLAAAGLVAVGAAPAHATGGTLQSGPFEVGNLLNYANSDFEGTIGNWAPVSNATLTDDPDHQFLHDASLLDTATSTGTSSFKLGNGSPAIQINMTEGATYQVSAYFRAPAASGQTVQFSLGCYDQEGDWLGSSKGPVNTLLDTTKWQYSQADIAIPATCTYVLGSPEVILGGLAAGAAVNMDEAIFAPYRAAMIIGAHGENGLDGTGTGYTAQDWVDTNGIIGPLQSDKQFPQPNDYLPASWDSPNNNCYEIEQQLGTADSANWPACLITYKYPTGDPTTEAQLQAFFTTSAGIPFPAQQMVIITYHDEAELPTSGLTGPEFVSQFDTQSTEIRGAAAAIGRTSQVFVATDSATYEYSNDSTHDSGLAGCSYIPTTSYVDFYLADHYDDSANGQSMPDESSPYNDEWSNWLACVQGINKPIGLAEYGQNCPDSSNPNASAVTEAITDDNAYLEALPNATEPIILWEYWFDTNAAMTHDCVFTNPSTISEWQSIETQNGGG
jgi:Carbohydrate binding domain